MSERRELVILTDFRYEDLSQRPKFTRSFRKGQVLRPSDPLWPELARSHYAELRERDFLVEIVPVDYLA